MRRKQISRELVRVDDNFSVLSDQENEIDAIRLDGQLPVEFKGTGGPAAAPFYITRDTWHALGDPDEITLTIVSNGREG